MTCSRAGRLIGGKPSHRVQLSFPRLAKSICVDDKAVFTIEFAAKCLKQQYFERVEQFTVLGQRYMRIFATKVEPAAFVSPLGRNRQIEPQV